MNDETTTSGNRWEPGSGAAPVLPPAPADRDDARRGARPDRHRKAPPPSSPAPGRVPEAAPWRVLEHTTPRNGCEVAAYGAEVLPELRG